jgi:hypothetical protein
MANHHTSTDDQPRPVSPSRRLEKTDACVPFSPAKLATENTFHSRGLIAIAICDDPWYRVTPDAVRTATSRWLDILASDVDLYLPRSFLLLLLTPSYRDRALSIN